MITSFETGATLVLKDEATAILERIATKLNGLEKQFAGLEKQAASFGKMMGRIIPPEFYRAMQLGADRFAALDVKAKESGLSIVKSMEKAGLGVGSQFEEMSKLATLAFGKMGDAAVVAADKMTGSMERFDAQVATSLRTVSELAARMDALTVLPSGGARAGGGARAHHGRMHFGRVGTEIPGGHVSMGGNGTLAALGVLGAAIYEDSELVDTVAKALITGQMPMSGAGDPMKSQAAMSLRELIEKTSAASGYSLKAVARHFLGSSGCSVASTLRRALAS